MTVATGQSTNWFTSQRRIRDYRTQSHPINLRRWDGAQTNRLNKAHWTPVTGATINQDLIDDLETLRTRAAYELQNNGIIEGMVATYALDVLGPHGPTLEVQTKRKTYARKLERIWRDWWEMPDIAAEEAGVDMATTWLRGYFPDGEFLIQIVTDKTAKGPVKARLHNLSPRRLGTPFERAFDPDVILGIERDKYGKRIAYYIDLVPEASLTPIGFTAHERVRAADILHVFDTLEAGQVRGVPFLGCGLPTIAELRDYDESVLDAAHSAADTGVMLHTNHPDSKFMPVNESVEIERGMMRTLPPGWDFGQLSPQQPATEYIPFRHERWRDVCRPICMPLMMLLLDSSNHNYSSARFDGQLYQRHINWRRGRLERKVFTRLLWTIAREAELAGALPSRPDDLRLVWGWTPLPHVDPLKEASAATERLNNGTSCISDEIPGDIEELIAKRQREKEMLEAAGLPTTPLRSVSLDKLMADVAAAPDVAGGKSKESK